MGNSPSDNSNDKHQNLPEANAIKPADAQAAANVGATEMKSVDASRTNASTGSLQDRRRLVAGQDDSIEITGPNASASRMSKLTEKDLLSPQSRRTAPPETNLPRVADSHSSLDEDGRPIVQLPIEQIGTKTYAIGVAYKADKHLTAKLSDFANAATTRLLDPAKQKAFIQSELNKTIGMGEGLNIAKEHTKGAAAAAWTAFSDGTVANCLVHFLSEPNAINDPLFKAVSGTLDVMEKDPNAVNSVLNLVGQEIMRSSEKYSSMSDREKGRFIGEVMFGMVNPEGSTEAGELTLGIANKAAHGSDRAAARGIESATAHGFDSIAAETLEQTAPTDIAHLSGAGGDWPVLNKRLSPDVMKQCHPNACVSAAGEMLANGKIKQETLVAIFKQYLHPDMIPKYPTADIEWLANELGSGWAFKGIGPKNATGVLDRLLQDGKSWATELRTPGKVSHSVVVDGLNESGEIMIRDPQDGERYEMKASDFMAHWTGRWVESVK